jgi:hypothetical protein
VSLHETSFASVVVEISDADRKMSPSTKMESVDGGRHLMLQLINAMWLLHQAHPANMALAPVCVPGEMCVKSYRFRFTPFKYIVTDHLTVLRIDEYLSKNNFHFSYFILFKYEWGEEERV